METQSVCPLYSFSNKSPSSALIFSNSPPWYKKAFVYIKSSVLFFSVEGSPPAQVRKYFPAKTLSEIPAVFMSTCITYEDGKKVKDFSIGPIVVWAAKVKVVGSVILPKGAGDTRDQGTLRSKSSPDIVLNRIARLFLFKPLTRFTNALS